MPPWIRSIGAFALYPALFFGALVAVSLARGAPWALGIVLVGWAALVSILERLYPVTPIWNQDHGDTRSDRIYLVTNLAVSQVAAYLVGLVAERTDMLALWPMTLPFALQVLFALVVVDVGLYAVHRVSHGVGWLWKLHAIHHFPRRIHWVNGQRRHVLHELLEGSPGLLVLLVLGAKGPVVASALAMVSVHLLLQHANVRYRGGVLRHVFAVAELHRWHHQRQYAAVQGNFAAVFSVWDRLFGTCLPEGVAPLEVGTDDEPTLHEGWREQQLWPFRTGFAVPPPGEVMGAAPRAAEP